MALKIFQEDANVTVSVADHEVGTFSSEDVWADTDSTHAICEAGIQWVANSGGEWESGCPRTEIEVNELTEIQFEIDWDGSSYTVTYQYFQCEDGYDEVDYGRFLCPNPTDVSGNNNDLQFVLTASGLWLVEPLGMDQWSPINVEISSGDWLLPHNLDVICNGNAQCLSKSEAITYFLSPQQPPNFDLADHNLTVPTTRTWIFDGVILDFASGRGMVVNGKLLTIGATLRGPGGTGSGSADSTRIDGIPITFGSTGAFLVGSVNSTFGSSWSGFRIVDNAQASVKNVTFSLPASGQVLVEGRLTAFGSTFQGVSGGSWSGIEFASTFDDSSLEDVTVDKVYLGYGSYAMIKTASGSSGDLDIVGSSIMNDDDGLADAILHYSTGTLSLYENLIDSDRGNAVRVSGYAPVYAYNNDIEAPSSYAGLYLSGGSDALLSDAGGNPGNNEFMGSGYSLRAYGSGTSIAGGGSGHNAYNNHFCGSGTKVLSENYAQVWAREDYWPEGDVPALFYQESGGGYVDATDDHEGEAATCSTVARKGDAVAWEGDIQNAEEDDLARAASLLRSARHAEARSLYAAVARSEKRLPMAFLGLKGLMRVFEVTRDPSLFADLSNLARFRPELEPFALQLKVHMYALYGAGQDAAETAALLREQYPGSDYAFFGALSLAHMHFAAGEVDRAYGVLGEIAPSNRVQAEILAGVIPIASKGFVEDKAPTAGLDGGGLELAAWPNPFNPTTTVSFRLEAETEIRVAVYDALGREVARLSSGVLDEGRHMLAWDAAGRAGGTYYVVVRGGDRWQTLPILLLK